MLPTSDGAMTSLALTGSPYQNTLVGKEERAAMVVKITAKRQVTFPARVLDALGVKPGDRLELVDSPAGFLLRPRRVDAARLAPLRDRLRRGRGSFDVETFRRQRHARTLRD
jgi:AbrB family looped-hinge helix DNA binding protein